MERDPSARGRGAAKAWEPVAAANAVAGVPDQAKGVARAAGVAAGDVVSEAASAKTRAQQKAPIQPLRQTKKNQTHKRKETIMPGGDQTGPRGQGPVTGGAAGYCAGFNQPGWMSRMGGRVPGGGRGWGGGRGHRHWFHATGLTGWQRTAMGMPAWGAPGPLPAVEGDRPNITQEQQLAWLKQQASQLEAGLAQIQNRIAELNKVEAK